MVSCPLALHLELKENVWAPIRMAMDDEDFCRYFRLFQLEGETVNCRERFERDRMAEGKKRSWGLGYCHL